MTNKFPKFAIGLGCVLLGNAVWIFITMLRATAAERAVSIPGEKNLGVGVLIFPYVVPFLVTAVPGILCVVLGIAVATFRRVRSRQQSKLI